MLQTTVIPASRAPQEATSRVQPPDSAQRPRTIAAHRIDSGRVAHTLNGRDTAAYAQTDTLTTDSTTLVASDSSARSWFAADSLGLLYTGSSEAYYRTVTDPREVFGATSQLVVRPPKGSTETHPLTSNAVFQGFVLLLAATYILLLYRHLGDVLLLFSRVLRTQSSGDRLTEEQRSMAFTRFLNITTAIGLLFIGVIVIRTGDALMPPELTRLLPQAAVLTMSLLVAVACLLVGLYQTTALRLAGTVTLTQSFISQLLYLRRIYFTVAVLLISPALLLLALCPADQAKILFGLIAAEFIITLAMYLRETLHLFLSKKVSILHWFLYLCAIEIFPVSLLWLIAVR